jgi:hypothetical protein
MSLKELWKNGIDFEKIDKSYLVLFFLLGFLLIFPFVKDDIVFTFNSYEQNKEWRKQDYEKEFFGRIIKKGRDKSNHNFAYFQLKDSTKIFENEDKIWKIVNVGDSVAKKRNSKILLVIKNQRTITVNYDDIYKYRDSLIRTGNY